MTPETTPIVCWRTRDCAPEVQEYCQHAVTDYDMCPQTCKFALCSRPEHKPTYDPMFVFEPNIDRDQALKQTCIHCEFFLSNGPKRDKDAPRAHEVEMANKVAESDTVDAAKDVQ